MDIINLIGLISVSLSKINILETEIVLSSVVQDVKYTKKLRKIIRTWNKDACIKVYFLDIYLYVKSDLSVYLIILKSMSVMLICYTNIDLVASPLCGKSGVLPHRLRQRALASSGSERNSVASQHIRTGRESSGYTQAQTGTGRVAGQPSASSQRASAQLIVTWPNNQRQNGEGNRIAESTNVFISTP